MTKLLNKIFSIKNEYKDNKKYKVITILGFKIKKRANSKFDKINREKYKRELTVEEKKYYLETQFEQALGYKLNLDNPCTFNEKIQWYKLNYRDPLMTKCADKVGVRDYIKEKIGEEYLIPSLGVYNTPDEINFENLPNQFVMKVNWGSGQNIIVKDKSTLNIEDAKEKLRNWLKPEANHYFYGLEWAYKDIKPKILIEKYLSAQTIFDYRYHCFNGNPIYLLISGNSHSDNELEKYFDMDFKPLNFVAGGVNKTFDYKECNFDFEKMKELAKLLSNPFPHVRVDFYSIDGEIYVGELTFYRTSGYGAFNPIEWDYKFGKHFLIEDFKNV